MPGQSRPVRRSAAPVPVRAAFSLVEMLVVAAIIALLVAIILPSMERAREQARSVKCQANVRAIAQATSLYTTKYAEWLPGSPGTSGSVLLGRYAGVVGKEEDMPEPPVQTWDYAGVLLWEAMGVTSLPANRGHRFKAVVEGVFACPCNDNLSMPFWTSVGITPVGTFTVQKAVSYATARNFMMWPKVTVDGLPWAEPAPFFDDGNPAGWDGNISSTSRTIIPRQFAPRVERVGQPSEKVLIADSSRFTDFQGVSHNIHWRGADYGGAAGGAFSTGSPTLPDDILRSYLREDPQRRYAYRHPQGKTPGMVAAYFDAHAEWLSERRSRDPRPWHPRGTVIPADEFNDMTLEVVQDELTAEGNFIVNR